ncbi:N-acetylglucosaminyltransferase, MurG [alpha proteobacterium BAL199]|jgi:UDP-N-acetylglucosamine--N-acetylmuramyl-(pentapeptide) pyrophosphoryl-undecaprenol N-acetylglucosamine transferase|nr:N-acetylglucosaminyltransferase, MurG [alpha proteobacterium BAL199]
MTGPILLAAGGTGGHVFPAKALADALLARGHRVGLVTDRRGTAFETASGQLEVHRIRAAGIAGRGLLAKAKAVGELFIGYFEARRLIRNLNPAVVVGFGGYASVPTVLAAAARKIPVVLHEQNAVLGRANRLLAARADAIAVSFADVEKVSASDRRKLVLTGNPVREAIRQVRGAAVTPLADDAPIAVLVTGGSQGASVFADLVPAAIALLPENLRRRLRLSQQARDAEFDQVVEAYRTIGVDADVRRFFDDMPARLVDARLLICRSGASTVAENTVAGRPALLVPYPHAIDDHQTANARAVATAGGARVLPQATTDAATLARVLTEILGDPSMLASMTSAARSAGVPDAVDRLADLVERQANLAPTGQAHQSAAATTASSARRATA